MLDKKREMFDALSELEKAELKESLRLFRNPFNDESPLGDKYNNVKNNPFRLEFILYFLHNNFYLLVIEGNFFFSSS